MLSLCLLFVKVICIIKPFIRIIPSNKASQEKIYFLWRLKHKKQGFISLAHETGDIWFIKSLLMNMLLMKENSRPTVA